MAKHTKRNGVYKRGAIYWINYTAADGTLVRESSHSAVKADAQALLDTKRVAKRDGSLIPDARKVTFEDLVAGLRKSYTDKGNRSQPKVLHLTEVTALLNYTDGGDGGLPGYQLTPAQRAKRSAAMKGKPHPWQAAQNQKPEHRERVRGGVQRMHAKGKGYWKGKRHTEQTRAKMRETWYGRGMPLAVRDAAAAALRARVIARRADLLAVLSTRVAMTIPQLMQALGQSRRCVMEDLRVLRRTGAVVYRPGPGLGMRHGRGPALYWKS
jgi:hypothetical protein